MLDDRIPKFLFPSFFNILIFFITIPAFLTCALCSTWFPSRKASTIGLQTVTLLAGAYILLLYFSGFLCLFYSGLFLFFVLHLGITLLIITLQSILAPHTTTKLRITLFFGLKAFTV